MKGNCIGLLLCLVVLMTCCGLNAQVPEVKGPTVEETKAQDVSVCDLKADPAKYNRASVKLRAYFSRGFEDSDLYDPTCKSWQMIWVELGGTRSVDVMYCCGVVPKPTRDSELKVEGISLPLTEDDEFRKYNDALAKGKKLKATVIGTFFSGEKTVPPSGKPFYSGYGHFGGASLFVVQQVIASEVTKVKEELPKQ